MAQTANHIISQHLSQGFREYIAPPCRAFQAKSARRAGAVQRISRRSQPAGQRLSARCHVQRSRSRLFGEVKMSLSFAENNMGKLPMSTGNITRDRIGRVNHNESMNELWRRNLEIALEVRRVSMKAASVNAGLGETFVRDILKRGITPKISSLATLAKSLEIDMHWLITGEGQPMRGAPSQVSLDIKLIKTTAIALQHFLEKNERKYPPEIYANILVAAYLKALELNSDAEMDFSSELKLADQFLEN